MTLLLHLVGCGLLGGPKPALTDAWTALAEGDLERFERVVVIEDVVPQAVEGCVRVSLLEEWAEQEQRPPNGLRDLGRALGRGLLTGVVEAAEADLVSDAREQFGTRRPDELCPVMKPGDTDLARVERNGDLAQAFLPVVAYDTDSFLVADMRKTDEGWKIVGLDFEPAITDFKAGLMASAPPQ